MPPISHQLTCPSGGVGVGIGVGIGVGVGVGGVGVGVGGAAAGLTANSPDRPLTSMV